MHKVISVFCFASIAASLMAAPTANEDFVVAEDAKTFTNAVDAAKEYTDEKIAAIDVGVTSVNGSTGDVTLVAADVLTPMQISDISQIGQKADERAWIFSSENDDGRPALDGVTPEVSWENGRWYISGLANGYYQMMPSYGSEDAKMMIFLVTDENVNARGLIKASFAKVLRVGEIDVGVTSVNGSTGAVTLVAADVGAVPTSRKVNGQPLTSDIIIAGGVTSVNGSTGDVTIAAADVGAVPTSRKVNGKALTGDVTLGASDVGAASADDVQTLNIGYTRLHSFNTGATNANFTVTNYPPTKAEADARCHWQPEPGMDFSTVPASLQLNEYRDGEWRTVVDTRDWTVWYYKFKEVQLTNELARLRTENEVLSNKVESAKAWGGRTANGIENPLDDTVVVDRPNMWLMADYEWQKCVSGSNQCFVLRAKNVALSGGANTNGFLEVCDAFGKPYMRINKSSETFADPVFSEIRFDQDEGAWYVVYSNSAKPTKGGANVVIQGNGSGKCILYGEDEEDCPAVITWPNVPESRAGHWIMKAVPKPVNGVIPDKMYFGAEIRIPGSDYVEYMKEASFGAGIRFGANVYDPVESGDQLIWRKRQ